MDSILADQREREQVAALARVFTKMDRILSGERVECVVAHVGIPAPSYTDGKTITFNRRYIKSCTSAKDIISVTGLNYHEFAHVWLTPRADSPIGRHVTVRGKMQAFNMLEDQRIESFLSARWPDTIPYLTAIIVDYCMANDRAWATNFALTYGRRYLPRKIRDEFRRRFIRPDLIPQFEAIIDEYRTMTFPAHEERAIILIDAFDALLKEMNDYPQDPHGHHTGQRGDLQQGEPAPEREQQQAADQVREQDEKQAEQEQAEDKPTEPTDPTDAEDEGDGEGDDSESEYDDDLTDPTDAEDGEDGDESSQSSQPDGDSDDPSDDGDDGQQDSGTSTGSQEPPMDDSDFKELLEDALDAVSNDDTVKSEVNAKQTAISNGGDVEVTLANTFHSEKVALPEDVMMARKFGSILDQLRADTDPGWKTHTPSGRLNLQRVLQGAEFSEMFDTWEEGNNASSDIECVVVIDVSDSMGKVIEEASRAMWTFKRGMEDIDARVTVMSFASKSHLVYDGHQKVSRTKFKEMRADGVTKPRAAVEEAVRILEASNRENKILIAITDGAWHTESATVEHPYSADELIQMLGERGVTTALAYIAENPQSKINAHNCHIAASVRNPLETVEFAKAIVRQSMMKPVGR